MSLRPRSVRFRLTLWYAAALAAIMFMFSVGVYSYVRANLFQQLDEQLGKDLLAIERVLPEEPYELAEIEEHGSVSLFQVVDGQSIIYQTDGWRQAELGRSLERGASDSFSWTSPGSPSYRVRMSTIVSPDEQLLVAVAQEDQAIRQSLQSLATTLLIGFPCTLILTAIGGYFLAGRVLSPIGMMASKAEVITADRLSERLAVENPDDEFGRLATVFNRTLAGLQESFEKLRRFTADASHELRTPLTAIRSVGEVGLRENRDAAEYREVIGSMLEEADRLARLVDTLLALTRADSREQVAREQLDLNLLLNDVTEYLRVLAEEKNQTLRLDVQVG
ncbi:HAMP domain-containing protein [Acidobacteria bacterium AH-259-O06]|nr:HAMP domain-containing protein [Acidobacteria bacterium AH-259-O06]